MNFFERDGLETYDSSPVIDADGTLLGVTRMVHITEYPCFHEQGYYTPGDSGAPVYETKAGRDRRRHLLRPAFSRVHARARRGRRRPGRRAAGRRGRRVARGPLRSRDARRGVPERLLTWRSATGWARKTASTSPASRSSAIPTAASSRAPPLGTDHILVADVDLDGRPRSRMRDGCSCGTGVPSCTAPG